MAEHNDFGVLAEDAAVAFLSQNAYDIVRRNYRFQKAEIDIIAATKNLVVFVEVKARTSDFFQEPQEAVNQQKIRFICKAANHFLEQTNEIREVRFDIITVLKDKKQGLKITHLPNAFDVMDLR